MDDDIRIGDEDGFNSEVETDVDALKKHATKKKGRGFVPDENKVKSDYEEYDNMDIEDNSPGPKKSVEGWILFVTNVHEEMDEAFFAEKFMEFGVVKNLHLNLDRKTGYMKGYALVEYETFDEANSALQKMNNTDMLGLSIKVSWAFVKAPLRSSKRRSDRYKES